MDMYHYYSCLAARETVVGSLPLGQKTQLKASSSKLGHGILGRATTAVAVEVLSEQEGFGQHSARQGDLVLVHYTGSVAETGQVFDTTRGGLKYRDGGAGVLRPVAFRLSGYPQPGLCSGLQEAIVGMKIGGQKSVLVPPEGGFGSSPVLAPYAPVPANATLRYDIELLRVSARGPDEMFKGISSCSAGGDSARTDGCADITPAEFY
eukprot:gene4551-4803_t